MFEYIESLPSLLTWYWYIAIVVSFVFVIQTVLTFLGGGDSDGLHGDFNSEYHADTPFELFSLRNLVNFLLGLAGAALHFTTRSATRL